KSRGDVRNAVYIFSRRYLSGKYIGIHNVFLIGGKLIRYRLYAEFPSFLATEKPAENKGAVKTGQAHPVYIGISVNKGQVSTIPDKAVLIRMSCHIKRRLFPVMVYCHLLRNRTCKV